MDDDCDGMVDEALNQACGSVVGACEAGSEMCAAGAWERCSAIGPALEACDGLLDEDCDGAVDEGCECVTGTTRACGSNIGACKAGIQNCETGAWASCTGSRTPSLERCNAMDDDCDGSVDESLTRPCGMDAGACKAGSETCVTGRWQDCSAVGPAAERCNGVDDDCDARTDESLARPCGSNVGVCTPGIESCASGAWQGCTGIEPGVERCNGMDDDCDGSVDEGLHCGPPCEEGISAGWGHTCARLETGEVRCWGRNHVGQLGDGTEMASSEPVSALVTSALDVAAGANGTCAPIQTGELLCWGDDTFGQMAGARPALVQGVRNAAALSLAVTHICASLASGQVMCWGDNRGGELGNGTFALVPQPPVFVTGIRDATGVAVKLGASCALRRTGEVLCWGINNAGHLGIGSLDGTTTPLPILHVAAAVQISAGIHHTCARLQNGQVKCWGHNEFGELGDGTRTVAGCP
ncbi:MAG: hypothetical protein MJD61_03345 [Proteobacteria bacterium]|nr:hypothetical protein [Pseudomonadota bacterium]